MKDRIIALISAAELDESTKSIWCDDAKGMYYLVVHTDVLLSGGQDADVIRASLHAACSRCEQVASELRALGDDGNALEQELRSAFAACDEAVSARIPAAVSVAPSQRVIKRSEQDYVLPCSVCGKEAVAVHPAGAEEKILKGIICAGITRAVGLGLQDQEKIFGWLQAANLAALHHYMESDQDIDGGLDAYCPQCDRIYCRTHYNVAEEWDDGFYDCARGTCPHGHSRKIDD